MCFLGWLWGIGQHAEQEFKEPFWTTTGGANSIFATKKPMLTTSPATVADIPALVHLVNQAYRGEPSRQGWTTEADLLKGDLRTDENDLTKLLERPQAVVLKASDEADVISGCVFLEKREERLYLGMLSVSPEKQAHGIGKQLLAAAAEHARAQGCSSIYMRVLSKRHELIGWYERHGYHSTGETAPYDAPSKYGVPTQPLEFVIMEKVV